MTCELLQPDLKAYRDNELPIVRRLAVRRHLSGCAACREELRTMEKIADTLQSTETSEPLPRDLRTRILADAAKQGKPSQAPPLLGAGGAKRRLSPALVGCICAVIAIGALVVMHPFGGLNSPSVELAAGHDDGGTIMQSRPNLSPAAKGQIEASMRAVPQAASGRTLGSRSLGGFAGSGTLYGGPPNGAVGQSIAKGVVAQPRSAPAQMDRAINGSTLDTATLSLDRQVHREASVTVQTKDPEASSDQVSDMVKSAGGYVASNNLSTDDGGLKSAQLDLKVPVAQFDTVLGQVEKLGNITAKNITGEDITGKVSDAGQAEAVLSDEVARSNAHLAAMGRHAKWEDEEDARELRIELAQARARVQLLHKLAQLSDITVTLNQTPKATPPAQAGMINNLRGNGSAAVQSMLGSLGALLTILIWVLAYIPIWGPIAFAVWYALRARRNDARASGV